MVEILDLNSYFYIVLGDLLIVIVFVPVLLSLLLIFFFSLFFVIVIIDVLKLSRLSVVISFVLNELMLLLFFKISEISFNN